MMYPQSTRPRARVGMSFRLLAMGPLALALGSGIPASAQDDDDREVSAVQETETEVEGNPTAPEAPRPSLPAAEDLDAFPWRELGPATFSGRIVDIELDPADPFTIFVGSASGGLFRSRNNGTTWECIFQDEGTISIGDVAIDPTDANVIWIGTGEANNQRSSYWGDGVYKSTDGGESWENLGLSDTHHIGRIAIDPEDPQRVFVAAIGHLYTENAERGLFRTVDGGASWEHVLDLGSAVGVIDVVIDPSDPNRVYAASYERMRRAWDFDGAGPGSGIWRSEDGGATFEPCTEGLPTGEIGRIGLTLHAGESSTLFASVSDQNLVIEPPDPKKVVLDFRGSPEAEGFEVRRITEDSEVAKAGLAKDDVIVAVDGEAVKGSWKWFLFLADLDPAAEHELEVQRGEETLKITSVLGKIEEPRPKRPRAVGGGVFRSTDHGITWEQVNEKPAGGSPAYYYGQIRVDPNDVDRLYMLSVPVYVSEDGGKTWQGTGARSLHVDHHALLIDPTNSNRVLLGNDGGLGISYDRCKTWDHYDNLPLAQFYAVGVDMQEPYHIYGGTQDNGTWGGPSRTGGSGIRNTDWYRVGGGDGFYAQIDPEDANIVFGESQFGAIYRRDLEGGSRSIRPPRTEPEGPADRYNWNSPILISHHNPRIVYFGGNRLFKSLDRGDHWHVVSEDLTSADPSKLEGNVPHCTITTIAESPRDPLRLMIGTDDGLVQRSLDGGLTFENLAGRFGGLPPNLWCSRVEYSNHETDRVYATFTGYREDDFRPFAYVSEDNGKTWRSIVEGLPEGPINVLREDPRDEDLLYLGTEFGIFASFDRGATWSELGQGLPTIAVHDLVLHPRDHDVVIATHGRGFWVLDAEALPSLHGEPFQADAHLAPVADGILWPRSLDRGGSGDRRFRGANPPTGVAVTYHLAAEVDEDDIELRIEDLRGKTLRKLEAPHEVGVHRTHWNLRRASTGRSRFGGSSSATPGTYVVVLEIEGQEPQRQEFEVRRPE